MAHQPTLREQGYVKVRLTGDDGRVETLWAVQVGRDRFRLDNLPWFAYRVSLGDVVEGREVAPGMYDFVRVVEPSGNRLIRVAPRSGRSADPEATRPMLDGLTALGCGWEGANTGYISVTIPPDVDIQSVADYLGRFDVLWEYANPTYDDLFGDPQPGG